MPEDELAPTAHFSTVRRVDGTVGRRTLSPRMKHHGLEQFLARGLAKATSVVLLGAIASNLLQHATTLLA
jgi:hypothetical protein